MKKASKKKTAARKPAAKPIRAKKPAARPAAAGQRPARGTGHELRGAWQPPAHPQGRGWPAFRYPPE